VVVVGASPLEGQEVEEEAEIPPDIIRKIASFLDAKSTYVGGRIRWPRR